MNDVKYKEPLTNGVVLLVSDDKLAVVESFEEGFKLVTTKLSDNEVLSIPTLDVKIDVTVTLRGIAVWE